MDNVVHPSMRKWISAETSLGSKMAAIIAAAIEAKILTKFDTAEAQRLLMAQFSKEKPPQAAYDAMSMLLDQLMGLNKAPDEEEDYDIDEDKPKPKRKRGKGKGKADKKKASTSKDVEVVNKLDDKTLSTNSKVQVQVQPAKDLEKEKLFKKLSKMTVQTATEHPGTLDAEDEKRLSLWEQFLEDSDAEEYDEWLEKVKAPPTPTTSPRNDGCGPQWFQHVASPTRATRDDGCEEVLDEDHPASFLDPGQEGGDGCKTDSEPDEAGTSQELGEEEDPNDTLEKWMKMGVKSGPHCLLSGDTDKKFGSFMDRAFKEKTARELKFAEEFKDRHMKNLGISEEVFKKLQEDCSPALAAVRGESFKDDPIIEGQDMPVLIPPIPDADKIELKTLAVLLTSTNPTGPIWRSNNVQQQIDDNMRHDAKTKRLQNRLQDYADGKPGLVDNTKDFVVEISVFGGRNPDESLPVDVKLYTEPKLVFKLHLLGTNTVADLRAALHCENELLATTEVESPDDVVCREEILKNKIPSWVLVLGNKVFGESTVDIATAMANWINEKPEKNLGPFVKGDNQTQLKDLTVRFGYPYVYVHIGKCEHIIVINQARMIMKTDEYRIEKYPVMPMIPILKNTFCRVDNEHMATWSVTDCFQFPENPMLVCTTCLRIFCYHNERKRIPFRLFPFRQLANEI